VSVHVNPNPFLNLTKLCKFAFTLKNSTTKLLPAWYATLTALKLPSRMMPCDVATCWNSTYDMPDFAIQFCLAINSMTEVQNLDLCKLELVSEEWEIATSLRDVLKVSHSPCFLSLNLTLD
jgi:hypothetical protein